MHVKVDINTTTTKTHRSMQKERTIQRGFKRTKTMKKTLTAMAMALLLMPSCKTDKIECPEVVTVNIKFDTKEQYRSSSILIEGIFVAAVDQGYDVTLNTGGSIFISTTFEEPFNVLIDSNTFTLQPKQRNEIVIDCEFLTSK